MFKRFQKVLLAGVVALGVGAGSAQAGDFGFGYDCHHEIGYEKIVTYVCKEIPYTRCITLYDHCGEPYTVHKTFYKTVHVPVIKYVPISYDY
jgi:hypothetical protein